MSGNTKHRWAVLLTLLITLTTLNFLASRHFVRMDLTQQNLFTLAPATRDILNGLEDIVTVRLYFSQDLPPELLNLRRSVTDVLDEFKNGARGKIRIEFHHPQKNVVEEQKVQMMGIPPVEVGVIKKDQQQVVKVYMGMGIQFGASQEIIPLVQNVNNLEYTLAAAIVKVTQAKKPSIGWWGGEREPEAERFSLLKDYLKRRFVIRHVRDKNLTPLDAKEIPVLIFPVPEKISENEESAFRNYVKEGGKVLLFVDRFDVGLGEGRLLPSPRANPLENFLKEQGVAVEPDLVVDASNVMATFTGGFFNYHLPYPFWVQIRPEGFNGEVPFVADLGSLVLPWVSSLHAAQKLPDGVDLKILFETTSQAAKTGALDPSRPLDPQAAQGAFDEGEKGKQILGVLLNDAVLVVGTSRLLQDDFLQKFEANLVFVENAIDIFSTGGRLIGIRTKRPIPRPIALLSDTARQTLRVGAILASPVLLLGMGGVIFWRRRRRQAK